MAQQTAEFWQKRKKLIDSFSKNPHQNSFPIVAIATKDGLYSTLDGNRRSLLAFFHEQSTISAWVGTQNGKRLKNYWVPTNELLQLAKLHRQAIDLNDENLRFSTISLLKHHFNSTEVAKIIFKNRIALYSSEDRELYEKACLSAPS